MKARRRARFEVYDADDQRVDSWRWRLVAANGEIVASGEGFTSQADARRAVRAVRRAVGDCGPTRLVAA